MISNLSSQAGEVDFKLSCDSVAF